MWKPGQLVTLWGSVYRITKCNETSRCRVCYFCAGIEKCAPCLKAYDFPATKGFDVASCFSNVPNGCYPKKVSK